MDAARFDALSRAFAVGHSRRGVTRLLGGLAIAGSLDGPRSTETLAKHKHKRKHKKKCAQAGQPTNKKHKQCCSGLIVDGSGVCNPSNLSPPPPVPPPPPCATTCTGCCDAAGGCQPGTSSGSCGGGGAACQVCGGSTPVCI